MTPWCGTGMYASCIISVQFRYVRRAGSLETTCKTIWYMAALDLHFVGFSLFSPLLNGCRPRGFQADSRDCCRDCVWGRVSLGKSDVPAPRDLFTLAKSALVALCSKTWSWLQLQGVHVSTRGHKILPSFQATTFWSEVLTLVLTQ